MALTPVPLALQCVRSPLSGTSRGGAESSQCGAGGHDARVAPVRRDDG